MSEFAVVTLAVGRKGRDLYDITRPFFEAAAARWGAELFVLGGDETAFNIGEKLRIAPLVAAHSRTFYADADALILPSCPSPFLSFPEGRLYAHDDLKWLRRQGKATGWIDDETKEICASQGWPYCGPLEKYWNSGVWAVDRAHAPIFAMPERPYPVWHCSEQHAVNARIANANLEVREIGRKWNWQWWIDEKAEHAGTAFVRHFSGMDAHGASDGEARHAARLALMRQTAPRPPKTATQLAAAEAGRAASIGKLVNDLGPGGLRELTTVDEATLASRDATCLNCPHLREEDWACRECEYRLAVKNRLAHEECPSGHWPRVERLPLPLTG